MDTATFFEKFSLFAQAEDAATRFREVVLNLAFSGKLKGTDLSGWETHPIGDFFTEGLKSINAPESPNQTYELWSVPSFETGAPEIVTGAQVGSTKRELRDGTILLGKINPHLNRIWVVNRRTNHPMIASQEWINVTAGDKWDTGYLARLLSSPSFNRSVCATAQGMGSLTRANTKQVAQIVVHCPPLKEQQKLIAKVDELMALCDQLEAQLKERDVKQATLAKAALAKFNEDPTPENLELLFHPSFSIEPEDLRRSLLTLAVKGKLTSQSNKDEPAGVLLARVILEIKRTKRKSDDQDEEQPHSGAAFPFCIPNNWQWIGATKVAVMVSDQDKKIPTNGILESGKHPVVDQGKMFVRGYSNDSDKLIKVDEPIILFGDHTRQTKYIDFDFIVGADGVKLLQPIGIDPQYYFLSLRWLPLESRGYARHFKLLKASYIPIPPLEEQHRIVAKVKELEAILDNLENQLEASRTTGEKLLEAMVAELTSA